MDNHNGLCLQGAPGEEGGTGSGQTGAARACVFSEGKASPRAGRAHRPALRLAHLGRGRGQPVPSGELASPHASLGIPGRAAAAAACLPYPGATGELGTLASPAGLARGARAGHTSAREWHLPGASAAGPAAGLGGSGGPGLGSSSPRSGSFWTPRSPSCRQFRDPGDLRSSGPGLVSSGFPQRPGDPEGLSAEV